MKKNPIKYLFLSLLIFISCKNDSQSRFMTEYFEKEDYNPEIIKEQRVIERIETEINTDSNTPIVVMSDGKDISPNKIRKIEYFNENGLCTLKINPLYKLIDNINTDYDKLSPLDKFFFQKQIEGNEPTGYNDSTYNFYDEKHRLIKEKEVMRTVYGQVKFISITTFTYDDKDNLILQCSESVNTQNLCKYLSYNYNSNGTIKSSKDSFSVFLDRGRPYSNLNYSYSYDSNNRIKSINDKYFVYDNNNLLVEEYELSGNSKINIINKKYDKNGNNIIIERIKPDLSSYDPKTNITSVESYDTTKTFKKYNNLNLLIEMGQKTSKKSIDYDLYKYEYKFK
jgi:hypothetical protein